MEQVFLAVGLRASKVRRAAGLTSRLQVVTVSLKLIATAIILVPPYSLPYILNVAGAILCQLGSTYASSLAKQV